MTFTLSILNVDRPSTQLQWRYLLSILKMDWASTPVSYTHLTLPTTGDV